MPVVKRKASTAATAEANDAKASKKGKPIISRKNQTVNCNAGYISCKDESKEQEVLIEWTERMKSRYPDLSLIYHVPNEGKRNIAYAAKMKRLGLKSGVPDLCLPVPNGKFHGMYIEMKANRNAPSEGQKKWLTRLSERGYYCIVAWSFDYARDEIIRYMRGEA